MTIIKTMSGWYDTASRRIVDKPAAAPPPEQPREEAGKVKPKKKKQLIKAPC